MTDSKPGADRSGHKRSWKNLLINKRYQLRFTLFMVGLTSLLMVGLGLWVMRVADETTAVSKASVRGEACPKLLSLGEPAPPAETGDEARPGPDKRGAALDAASDTPAPAAAPSAPAPASDPAAPTAAASPSPDRPPAVSNDAKPAAPEAQAGAKPGAGSAAGSGAAGAPTPGIEEEPRHAAVQLEESSITQTLPVDLADRVAAHWMCELRQVARFDRLERGRLRILWSMIGTGILLVLGLAAYGLKMTHRVAGPLFKVRLYLTKMRQGRFDTVYNLRKGDQLIEFYEHFKHAHGGVVAMQRADIDKIAAVVAAADAAGRGHEPAVAELRELLARKEKSIE